MQTITTKHGPLTAYFKPYYELYSTKAIPDRLAVDRRMGRVLAIVNEKADKTLQVTRDLPVEGFGLQGKPADPTAIYVAFSGGKDCLATALRAKEEGYKPTLVYIAGINKSLSSERRHAEAAAAAAGFPLVQIKLTLAGKKDWNEHPMKNILILCLLLDEGLQHGVTHYALGNIFEEDSLHGSLDYDLSDSVDMIHAFNRFVCRYVPGYKYHSYICNNLQSFYTIVKHDPALIDTLSTCITPDFRKPMIHNANAKKYGDDCVPADHCGACYKCADAYLFKVHFGLIEENPDYTEKAKAGKKNFDVNYVEDFKDTTEGVNAYGGHDTASLQVLCDRCGYYIGRLEFDPNTAAWYTHSYVGHKHYSDRQHAEKLCSRLQCIIDYKHGKK